MKMNKQEIIKEIKSIFQCYDCFSIGELELNEQSIYVGQLGDIVGLAEYFTEDYTEVYVYHTGTSNSDEIHKYEEMYENLSEEILIEILSLCQEYVRQINTGILN